MRKSSFLKLAPAALLLALGVLAAVRGRAPSPEAGSTSGRAPSPPLERATRIDRPASVEFPVQPAEPSISPVAPAPQTRSAEASDAAPMRLAEEIRSQGLLTKSPSDRLHAILQCVRDARRSLRRVEGEEELASFFRPEDRTAIRSVLVNSDQQPDRRLTLKLLRDLQSLEFVEDVLIQWAGRPADAGVAIPFLAQVRSATSSASIERLLTSELASGLSEADARDRMRDGNLLARELARQGRAEFQPLIVAALQRAERRGEDDLSLLSYRSSLARLGDAVSFRWIGSTLREKVGVREEPDWTYVSIAIRTLGFTRSAAAAGDLLGLLESLAPKVSPQRMESLIGHACDALKELSGGDSSPTISGAAAPMDQVRMLSQWWSNVR